MTKQSSTKRREEIGNVLKSIKKRGWWGADNIDQLLTLQNEYAQEIIGEDETWGTYGDYGDIEKMEKDVEEKSLRNQLKAEQRKNLTNHKEGK